jgi:hypothetical protein
LTLLSSLAHAQAHDEFDKSADDKTAAEKNSKDETGKKMPGEKDKVAPPDPDAAKYDPKEDPGKAYRFIGMRFRDVVVPKFMVNIFADGGTTVNAFTFGPELSIRKDHTEYDFALSYADYSMNPFLFKGHSDGPEAYELVASSMKIVYLTLDILYSIPLDQKGHFDFLFGGGVGLGGVFGNLYRSQAYPSDPNNLDPSIVANWHACPGAQPLPKAGNAPFCDASNNHYTQGGSFPSGSYDEHSWANGGSKPFIFPWISLPQFSLRYKPIKQLQTRADIGFSITGFYWGLSAGYGL